jgi:hypothetical protein
VLELEVEASRREIDCLSLSVEVVREEYTGHWQDKRRTESQKSEAIRISKKKSRASKSRAKTQRRQRVTR